MNDDEFLVTCYAAGLLMGEGDDWLKLRRLALTTLRDYGLGKQSMEMEIQSESRALLHAIDDMGGQPFDPGFLLNNVTSNVICSMVFGER